MAAGAILRPADHDQHAAPRRGRRQVQDADEFRLCAGEGYRALRHRRHGRNRPSVAAMSAGAKVISWSVQNGAPTTARARCDPVSKRSEEHTSELQSLMRISYAVFCLKKKKTLTK